MFYNVPLDIIGFFHQKEMSSIPLYQSAEQDVRSYFFFHMRHCCNLIIMFLLTSKTWNGILNVGSGYLLSAYHCFKWSKINSFLTASTRFLRKSNSYNSKRQNLTGLFTWRRTPERTFFQIFFNNLIHRNAMTTNFCWSKILWMFLFFTVFIWQIAWEPLLTIPQIVYFEGAFINRLME